MCYFSGFNSPVDGLAIYFFNSASTSAILNCMYEHNKNNDDFRGTVFVLSSNSLIKNQVFFNCSRYRSTTLHVESLNDSIVSCISVSHCHVERNPITFLYSGDKVSYMNFSTNKATLEISTMWMRSYIRKSYAYFIYIIKNESDNIMELTNSLISHCVFLQNKILLNYGLVRLAYSYSEMQNSSIFQNTGAYLFSSFDSYLTIRNCISDEPQSRFVCCNGFQGCIFSASSFSSFEWNHTKGCIILYDPDSTQSRGTKYISYVLLTSIILD